MFLLIFKKYNPLQIRILSRHYLQGRKTVIRMLGRITTHSLCKSLKLSFNTFSCGGVCLLLLLDSIPLSETDVCPGDTVWGVDPHPHLCSASPLHILRWYQLEIWIWKLPASHFTNTRAGSSYFTSICLLCIETFIFNFACTLNHIIKIGPLLVFN